MKALLLSSFKRRLTIGAFVAFAVILTSYCVLLVSSFDRWEEATKNHRAWTDGGQASCERIFLEFFCPEELGQPNRYPMRRDDAISGNKSTWSSELFEERTSLPQACIRSPRRYGLDPSQVSRNLDDFELRDLAERDKSARAKRRELIEKFNDNRCRLGVGHASISFDDMRTWNRLSATRPQWIFVAYEDPRSLPEYALATIDMRHIPDIPVAWATLTIAILILVDMVRRFLWDMNQGWRRLSISGSMLVSFAVFGWLFCNQREVLPSLFFALIASVAWWIALTYSRAIVLWVAEGFRPNR